MEDSERTPALSPEPDAKPDSELGASSFAAGGVARRRVPGHWIFLGPHGMRAGWSIVAFAGLWFVLISVCQVLVTPHLHLIRNQPVGPFTGLLLEGSQFVPVLIATAAMAMFERRPLLFYGYRGSARVVRLISGIIWGFVAISAVVLVLRQLGYLSIEGRTLSGMGAVQYAGEWGGLFLLVGLTEESTFRGYVQFTITRGIGFWWGALLFAVLFGFVHGSNGGESPVGLIGAGAVGLIFCLSLWYTGSLWWAVGFHAAWDWGQSYFYGTADSGMVAQGHLFSEHATGRELWSGGATGPEGSVIVFPLLAVVAVLMWAWWGRREKSPFAGSAWGPGRLPVDNWNEERKP
jgi:membrane protease YdiL (CAAX protease family)